MLFLNETVDLVGEEYMQVSQTVERVAKYVFVIHIIVAVFGTIANIFIIFRVVKLAMTDYEKFRKGIASALLIMAITDLLSLLMITSHYGLVLAPNSNTRINDFLCKVSVSHSALKIIQVYSFCLILGVPFLKALCDKC